MLVSFCDINTLLPLPIPTRLAEPPLRAACDQSGGLSAPPANPLLAPI